MLGFYPKEVLCSPGKDDLIPKAYESIDGMEGMHGMHSMHSMDCMHDMDGMYDMHGYQVFDQHAHRNFLHHQY